MARFILHLKTGETKLVEASNMNEVMSFVGDKLLPEKDMYHTVVSISNIDGPLFDPKLREKLLKQFE